MTSFILSKSGRIFKRKYLKNDHLIILILFFMSLAIRLFFMSDGLFHHDGVRLAQAMENTIETGRLHQAASGRYGLVLVYSLPYYFYRDSEFVATFMTVVFGALCIPVLYLLVKRLFKDKFISISTALLFSFSPLFLSITTQAKSHSIALFFILLSLYFFVKGNQLISSVFFCISLFMRFDNIVYLGVFVLIAIYQKYDHMFIFFIPVVLLSMLNQKYGWLFINSQDHLIFNIGYLNLGLTYLIYSVSIISFIIFCISLSWLWLNKRKIAIFLIMWLVITFISFTFTHALSSRFLINALIPIYICISFLLRRMKFDYRYIALGSIMIMMLLTIYPTLLFRHHYTGGKELSLYLANFHGNMLVGDYGPFVEYYTNLSITPMGSKIDGITYTTNTVIKDYNLDYDLEEVGSIVFEDYHHTELGLDLHNETIYKIVGGYNE